MNRVQIQGWNEEKEDWQLLVEMDSGSFARALQAIKTILGQRVLSHGAEMLSDLAIGQQCRSIGPLASHEIANINRVWHSLLPMLGIDHLAVASGWLVMAALVMAPSVLIIEVAA